MPIFKPNEQQLEDWKRLHQLRDELIGDLINYFEQATSPMLKASDLRDKLEEMLGDSKDARALARQLISLASLERDIRGDAEEIVDGVFESIAKRSDINLSSNLRSMVLSGVKSKVVKASSKALSLSYEFERVFARSLVLTDIRPVFSEGDKTIDGTIVLQTLSIEYREDGNRRSIAFGLDGSDIDDLINQLERARLKAETAKALMLDSADVDTFIVGEETYGF